MSPFTKGDIPNTGSQRVSLTLDYNEKEVGPCWIGRSITKEHNVNVRKGKTRTFHIPDVKGTLIDELCRVVKGAEHMVCVSSFLIQNTAFTDTLLEVADRGIPVFLLTAREEDLKKPADEMLEDELSKIDAHINLLKTFAGRILVRTCDNFHAKYCIADPLSSSPKGILMTCNANLDPMTGSNIELAVSLTEKEIQGLYSHFLHGFWDMANHELLSPGKFRGVRKEGFDEIDRGTVTVPATWNDGLTLRHEIKVFIESARESLTLTAWGFEKDNEIFTSLLDAINRGVSVKIMMKPTKKTTAALLPLIEKGAEIIGHDRFHAKIVIADHKQAIIMTANFTKKGLAEGFEAGILLDGHDVKILDGIVSSFALVCPWTLSENAMIKKIQGRIRKYSQNGNDPEEHSIIPEIVVDLAPLNLESLNNLPSEFITKEMAEKVVNEKYLRKLIANRIINFPRIPTEAKPEDQKEIPFPVFRMKKNLYIAIRKWEDLELAKEFARKLNAKVVVGS